jgi:hypothetical protein
MKTTNWPTVLVSVLFLCSTSANAESITVAISGHVTSCYQNGRPQDIQLGSTQISIGDAITGTYTFDTAISGLSGYDYYAPPAGVSLEINGLTFQTNPNNVWFLIGITNNDSLGQDVYSWRSYYNLFPLSNGFSDTISWQLEDDTGTALSSNAFPLTAPDVSKWRGNGLQIDSARGGNYVILGAVTSAVLVPEPCSLLLLMSGFILMKRQQSR